MIRLKPPPPLIFFSRDSTLDIRLTHPVFFCFYISAPTKAQSDRCRTFKFLHSAKVFVTLLTFGRSSLDSFAAHSGDLSVFGPPPFPTCPQCPVTVWWLPSNIPLFSGKKSRGACFGICDFQDVCVHGPLYHHSQMQSLKIFKTPKDPFIPPLCLAFFLDAPPIRLFGLQLPVMTIGC